MGVGTLADVTPEQREALYRIVLSNWHYVEDDATRAEVVDIADAVIAAGWVPGCPSCKGRGGDMSGPCRDCQGTGEGRG